MKILILANSDSGLYQFRLELIQQLIKKYEVFISLPYGDYIPKLQALGCIFIETPISRRGTNPITDIKLIKKFNHVIKNVKPDMVFTYTIKPNIYGGLLCRIYRLPYLTNITGLGSAVEKKGFMQKLTLFLYRIALKRAFCIFFQNKENLELFRNRKIINKQNIRLIPGSGVNLKYFELLEYPADENINFLYIGRIMKEKGIDQYFEAAEYIKLKYPNTNFHIIGYCEDDYEEKLKVLQEKGIIQYHGRQDDVRIFHRISHCTIHPTYYPEGMSNVLLESAACGRPVITTNRSGCKEIVDDGVNGYLVKQRDSRDLIEKIEKFIRMRYEDKKKMGLAGRAKVEKDFDRQIVINAYLEEVMRTVNPE